MPFGDLLAQIRAAAVLTGMHEMGLNMIFMRAGIRRRRAVSAGLLHGLFPHPGAAPRPLAYLGWTNAIASNAFANYDTVVEPHAFVELMRRAPAPGGLAGSDR